MRVRGGRGRQSGGSGGHPAGHPAAGGPAGVPRADQTAAVLLVLGLADVAALLGVIAPGRGRPGRRLKVH